ncbi:MAG: RidA family protein [Planctomycetota bacterium]
MNRTHISTGSTFESEAGYSRAVVQGDWCFVSGTTGYNYADMTMPESVEAQTENCLATIADSLQQAGFSLEDIVRIRYYVTDPRYAEQVFPVVGKQFADIRPAATMVVTGLIRSEMKIEIEATAFRNSDSTHSDSTP